ncbi:uncharacterized protein J3D65DRAFT_57656 [Phyllosticta citribraziliensis]|uniref:Uncharacterized protein n=1 Tax=Phyllosticta citribraziliensis TaxID=989973 RepID=A0ABR1LC72_9PEZI
MASAAPKPQNTTKHQPPSTLPAQHHHHLCWLRRLPRTRTHRPLARDSATVSLKEPTAKQASWPPPCIRAAEAPLSLAALAAAIGPAAHDENETETAVKQMKSSAIHHTIHPMPPVLSCPVLSCPGRPRHAQPTALVAAVAHGSKAARTTKAPRRMMGLSCCAVS